MKSSTDRSLLHDYELNWKFTDYTWGSIDRVQDIIVGFIRRNGYSMKTVEFLSRIERICNGGGRFDNYANLEFQSVCLVTNGIYAKDGYYGSKNFAFPKKFRKMFYCFT